MTDTTIDTSTDDDQKPGPEQKPADKTDSGNREAAKYRTQLRETETERDGLREQVTTMRRAEVQRIAETMRVAKPEAIWAAGLDVADVLDDNGNIDPAKAQEAITSAMDTLGLARKPGIPRSDPSQGKGGGSSRSDSPWADLIERTRAKGR